MLRLFKVVGISMLPTYKPNDYLVCLKTKNINVNDVIVMETNDLGKVVKRVKSISGNSLKILGDNKSYHSPIYDVTHYLDAVIGRVIFKLF
ncbi:hypothetical protein OAE05_03945 [Gammaproteobacteria bacterium]|nr:hypothetical protein [Gammaproteobacteria bacterium]